jgi:hypothetical protein
MTTGAYNDLVNLVEMELQEMNLSIPAQMVQSGIFNEVSKPDNTGKYMRFEEFSTQEYAAIKPELNPAHQFSTVLGYAIDATLSRYGENVIYSYEAKNYDKYETAMYVVNAAIRSMTNRFDLDLQHRLTFGESTTYVNRDGMTVNIAVGDGKALFASDHTLLASPNTFSNIIPGNPRFSRGALEGATNAWNANTVNQFGEKVGRPFNVIYSTDEATTCNAIRELLFSTGTTNPGQNEGVINPYKDQELRHVKLSRMNTDAAGASDSTKDYMWGMIRTGRLDGWQAQYAINEAARLEKEEGALRYDTDIDAYIWPVRMGTFNCILSGQFCFGSNGTGVA